MLTPAGMSALWAAAGPRSSAKRAKGERRGSASGKTDNGPIIGLATVRSAGEAGAEEAEPWSRFPGLGPVVEFLWGRGAAA